MDTIAASTTHNLSSQSLPRIVPVTLFHQTVKTFSFASASCSALPLQPESSLDNTIQKLAGMASFTETLLTDAEIWISCNLHFLPPFIKCITHSQVTGHSKSGQGLGLASKPQLADSYSKQVNKQQGRR